MPEEGAAGGRAERRAGAAAWAAVALAVLAATGAALFADGAAAGRPGLAPTDPYYLRRAGVGRLSAVDFSLMSSARMSRVVDGDTVVLVFLSPPEGLGLEEKARLVGVDTPERGEPVEPLALEATAFTEKALRGRPLLVAFDRTLRDRYGRILVYVFLPGGACHNAELVSAGLSRAYLDYPFALEEDFLELEAEARRAGRGMWAAPRAP